MNNNQMLVEKLNTGIEGFDLIAEGGLPKGRDYPDVRHCRQRQDYLRRPISVCRDPNGGWRRGLRHF